MLNARDAWQATLGHLQLQLNRATFDTWLKGTELMAYEDGEFVVRVRNGYAKDWLEKHLNHLVVQTLGSIFGRTVQVRYVVQLPAAPTPAEAQPGTLWAATDTSAETTTEATAETASEAEEATTGSATTAAAEAPVTVASSQATASAAAQASPSTAQPSAQPPANGALKSASLPGDPAPATPPAARTPSGEVDAPAPAPNSAAPADDVTAKQQTDAPGQQDDTDPVASVIAKAEEIIRQASAAAPAASVDFSEWDPRFSDVQKSAEASGDARYQNALNRLYTFDTFVTGPSNHFAYAAAKAVAEGTATTYNPLFIYGGSGMGKTHLLQAIGHACEARGKRVVYVTAEAFTNEMVAAIRGRTMDAFRARYREAEVLLLDDAHFLAGKSSTEEEFYHTFNAIFSANGQIVLAGDGHPRTFSGLDDRVRSRFEGGLLADIQAPEYETRLAILKSKAARQGCELPETVAAVLAQHTTGNVRELEGLLTQVVARATLTHQPLTVELADTVIDKHSGHPATPRRRQSTSLEDVLKAAATYYQLSLDDLASKRRTKDVVRARYVAIYLAREETDASLPQIGEALGGRQHSTVLHGYKKIADEVKSDDALRREISAIRRQLQLFPSS